MKDGHTLGNWSYKDLAEWRDNCWDTIYPLIDEEHENVTHSSVGNTQNDEHWNLKLPGQEPRDKTEVQKYVACWTEKWSDDTNNISRC